MKGCRSHRCRPIVPARVWSRLINNLRHWTHRQPKSAANHSAKYHASRNAAANRRANSATILSNAR